MSSYYDNNAKSRPHCPHRRLSLLTSMRLTGKLDLADWPQNQRPFLLVALETPADRGGLSQERKIPVCRGADEAAGRNRFRAGCLEYDGDPAVENEIAEHLKCVPEITSSHLHVGFGQKEALGP